eukprot:CAMPEP_0206436460 /NCGR_PEP_ID=MMETSP0324_2-20121206/10492_1 /ASSEMBLY_ACC=CAM_ASM_000836 /TAXON_ID=2866 /ORGANISM="Crypthecodinium cohnii, Strain Seligo" /LENGTH=506 /DNA_ID=CAMNT_0053903621 /DNA_START=24 /DNA_END=1544 /DNA_ORIENTATION=-
MKLDVTTFRYITKDEFRVLTAVEMGMRNHELVPATLIESIAKVSRGGCYKLLQALLRHKLVAHDGKKYDGWRLTYHGYDYLALRALALRGSISAVGRRLGVGKESDVHYAQGPNGELLALKLHRLGRVSFRAIKSKRDYLRGREHASWMYMARLAAVKEYAYMKALGDEGFPVPTPVDQNRHVVVMSFIHSVPLYHIRHLNRPHTVLEKLMRLLVRLARAGVVHGDFNEFNLMIDRETEKVTLIDFPQLVHAHHANAEEYFDRDVMGVREFFRKRMNIEVETWPTWKEVSKLALGDEEDKEESRFITASASVLRTGEIDGLRADESAMLVAAHEESRAAGGEREEGEESDDDEDEEESDDDGEDDGPRKAGDDKESFQRLLAEGETPHPEEEEEFDEEELKEPAGDGEKATSSRNKEEGDDDDEDAKKGQDEENQESDSDSQLSEASDAEAVGQVPVAGKRTRKRTNAKDARKNLQRQQKSRPARANNQKSKDMRRAKNEVKEYFG